MVFRRLIAVLIFAAAAAACTPAAARTARTTADVNMRAGPSVRYHRIAVIPAGSRVDVRYCLDRRAWCRVRWRGLGGWVSRRYLSFAGYRPRYYSEPPIYYPRPPGLYFEYRDRRWRDGHDRWHKKRPYPRKKSDRRKWNRDHDRWHRRPPRKTVRKKATKRKQPPKRRIWPPRDGDRRGSERR